MQSLSWPTATAAALTLTAVASFLIHLTTMEDGLGFSKLYVYGAYALGLRKKAHYLKLYQEQSLDKVVEHILKHLGVIVATHLQFLVFAFALKNVDSNEDGTSLEPAVLVFYLNLLLGAAFAVRSAFGVLMRGEMRVPWRHEIMGNDDPLSCFVKNTPKIPRRGLDGFTCPY